jgi:hypothetical protein
MYIGKREYWATGQFAPCDSKGDANTKGYVILDDCHDLVDLGLARRGHFGFVPDAKSQ